jgi:hypothetical protein
MSVTRPSNSRRSQSPNAILFKVCHGQAYDERGKLSNSQNHGKKCHKSQKNLKKFTNLQATFNILNVTLAAGPFFRPQFQGFLHRRVPPTRCQDTDIQVTLLCVCGVEVFIPYVPGSHHLIEKHVQNLFAENEILLGNLVSEFELRDSSPALQIIFDEITRIARKTNENMAVAANSL